MSVLTAKLCSDEADYLIILVRNDLRRRPPAEDELRGRLAKDILFQLGVPDDEVERLLTTPRLQVLP